MQRKVTLRILFVIQKQVTSQKYVTYQNQVTISNIINTQTIKEHEMLFLLNHEELDVRD